ncbi:Hydrolase [Granulibacter bethesdensis]|uniref:Hydrolase n=1 Tax=Granulibacter bethesdensis TaxID=364410 RepID=A0AAC9KCG1_9PROT|nr:alpha/beta hydrolase [Granulibacter bethesdensis]APH54778.1 Hydrolase [Granulibacter bethesdensis]APH62364.1 Hydrolase [Granulibacter bethesdensis]
MAYVETRDGTRLFYHDWGQGHPVILIHGWPLNADMWEYQQVFLAEQGFRTIAYDRRGFGRSDKPWTGYDYDTFADDLADLINALDLHNATLVGFSMGGGEVARYLSRHGSARISKAALIAAVTPFLLRTDDHPEGIDGAAFDQMINSIRSDRASFMAGFGRIFFGAGLLNFQVTSDVLQWSWGLAMQASPKATLDCVRAFSATDFRADMHHFTMPTLIVHGDADATVPPDITAHSAASIIPNAMLKEYEGEPHGLYFTARDRLNSDLLAFLSA